MGQFDSYWSFNKIIRLKEILSRLLEWFVPYHSGNHIDNFVTN